jgi:ubiquinone/menaquinone biosynthesis C-methylase UbiE
VNIYDIFMSPLEKIILARIRKNIIPMAFGNVLEIGYGTGVNFPYYNPVSIKSFSALDIQSTFSVKAKAKLPIKFFEGRAENLPFADESFDTVVETLVFCSVENPDKTISEVLRVLKPGGLFIFIDHVLPEKKILASMFKVTNTIWPKIAGGCNLTRESHKIIEAAGLNIEQSGRSGHDVFRWGIGRKIP